MARNTCLKILTQSHFTPTYENYSSFTEWTLIADLEDCYQDDEMVLTEQTCQEIRKLVEDSYDGHLLEHQLIELADWEAFENDVSIPKPTIICQRFYTFNRLVGTEEFLPLYHFGENE